MPGLDWEKATKHQLVAARDKVRLPEPTNKQLELIGRLRHELGLPELKVPMDRTLASRHIENLLAVKKRLRTGAK